MGRLVRALILILSYSLSCKAYLQGGDVTCHSDSEGRIIQVPRITGITPCIECKCSGGVVKCKDRSKSCPSIQGCYNIVRTGDKCCPFKCKDCVGVQKSHGAFWIKGRYLSQCYAGIVTTSLISPDSVFHVNATLRKKECKTEGNQILLENQILRSKRDPCSTCVCLPGGILDCARRVCPVLDCPERLIIQRQGKCCPECSRNRDFSGKNPSNNMTCIFQDKVYSTESPPFQDASCPSSTNCTCKVGGVPECVKKSCPKITKCPEGSHIIPGKCCPECREKPDALGHVLKGYVSSRSCVSNGKSYSEGQQWKLTECVTCSCIEGEVKCKTISCPSTCPSGYKLTRRRRGIGRLECCEWECRPEDGVCTVFGDPHYKTFDGRIFNFQGSCKYLLAQECDPLEGSHSKNSSFSIRITNDARDSFVFSWTRTITVRLPGVKVSLLQRMRVKINGKKVSLPFIKLGALSVMRDGYRIILRTNEGVRLLWDGVSFLEVTVPSKFRNRVCGLCGNFNGDKRDDFYGKSGNRIVDGQKFGDSWRVGGLKACSILPRDMPRSYEPSCSQNWESKIKSDKNCNAFKSILFQKCTNLVKPDYYFNACKLDMCECPGDQCHCEVLTAYARECERAGILIHNWREATGCKNVSSFTYIRGSSNVTAPSKNEVTSLGSTAKACTLKNSRFCEEPVQKNELKRKNLPRPKSTRKKNSNKKRRRQRRKRKKDRKRRRSRKTSSARKESRSGARKEFRRGRKKSFGRKGRRRPPPFEILLAEEESSDSPSRKNSKETTSSDDGDSRTKRKKNKNWKRRKRIEN